VGIAGVGRDAAYYKRGDPATDPKRGPLSYDGSATLDEIQNGRGLSNTILMIQVPHDGDTGVSPWIAGGGATLRGVPESNSIAPFVLSKDRNKNDIGYSKDAGKTKQRGTYVLMTDGSVRFLDQSISDEAFKAMCTINGERGDPKDTPHSLLVPPPTLDKPKELPKKQPPVEKQPPMEKQPEKADPEKKAARAVDLPLPSGEKSPEMAAEVLTIQRVPEHGRDLTSCRGAFDVRS
jgi:hypothetical protein